MPLGSALVSFGWVPTDFRLRPPLVAGQGFPVMPLIGAKDGGASQFLVPHLL